jgi:GTP-binding protein Era
MPRCGIVAIFGCPNVGKSTLLNRLLGQKLSITSRKPQTTRQRILGIHTEGETQVVYVDTPGLQVRPAKALNRSMNREALGALEGVDLVLFVVQADRWTDVDEHALAQVRASGLPVILAVNKVDLLKEKRTLLPVLENLAAKHVFHDILPVSARNGDNIDALHRCIVALLPERDHLYDGDQISDRGERFFAAEIVREKLVRLLGEELPYATTVVIDEFKDEERLIRIAATIWVERSGQKPIVVGKGGQMLRRIGEQARHDIERFLGRKVFLQTWVRVKENWSDDSRLLRQLGIDAAD